MKPALIVLAAFLCAMAVPVKANAAYEDDPCHESGVFITRPATPPPGYDVPEGIVWENLPECIPAYLNLITLEQAAAEPAEPAEPAPAGLPDEQMAVILAGLGLLVLLSAARTVHAFGSDS